MGDEVAVYLSYLQNVKNAAGNTVRSYQRDLKHFITYLEGIGISDFSKVTRTCLNSYLLSLEREGKASSSISRMLASLRSFFHYELNHGKIQKDPCEMVRGPRVEKKEPTVMTEEEVESLLSSPSGNSPKEIRDRAMLSLLYDTGIHVSGLVGLKIGDLNRSLGYISVRGGGKEKVIPYGAKAAGALEQYLSESRPKLLKGKESDRLFVNCSGEPMSRQGLWKIVKHYGDRANIRDDISPYSLKHSSDIYVRPARDHAKKPVNK